MSLRMHDSHAKMVPSTAGFRFKGVVEDSWLCDEGKTAEPAQVKAVYSKGLTAPTGQIRLVRDKPLKKEDCTMGIEVFPSWEFVLVAIFVVTSFLMSAAFALFLFRPWPSQTLQEFET